MPMNLNLFEKLFNETDQTKFGQQKMEWKNFMEFVYGYFESRGITNPLVVEIGIWHGNQKKFYKQILNADHISIDIADTYCKPDILGNSNFQSTLNELKNKLNGRQIDLLFIDGFHTYEALKADYEMYSPLAKHLVIIHDICTVPIPEADRGQPIGVYKFWDELVKTNKKDTFITFHHHNNGKSGIFTWKGAGREMGIGLIVKRENYGDIHK